MIAKQVTENRIFYKLAMFAMLLSAFAILYIFYLIFFPQKTIEVKGPITPNEKIASGSGAILYNVKYCKLVDTVSLIYRNLESSDGKNIIIPYALLSSNAPVGCGEFHIPFALPEDIEPGSYRGVINIQHFANPIRAIFNKFKTESFTVKPLD